MARVFTIGHSTRTLQELIAALQAHGIRTLVDIRSFPMSRRLPHFNREALEQELPRAGIAYIWVKDLGGRRKKLRDDSPNVALRNGGFRNDADEVLTEHFQSTTEELLRLSGEAPTAIMCAERVYFRCHRMLVSDYLVARGHEVLHIDDTGPVRPHKLMAEARMVDGQLLYRGDRLL